SAVAELWPAVERPHAFRRKHADVDGVAGDDILVTDRGRRRHLPGRHLATHLLLQDLHRLQRMLYRLLADHQAEARQVAADHVVERAGTGMSLDCLGPESR